MWRRMPWVLLILALAMTGLAAGHPPSGLDLVYNETSGDLIAAITHPVEDQATHYVREVVVLRNGLEVARSNFTSQPARDTFLLRYPLPLDPGDAVSATAVCNTRGSAAAHLTMPGPTATVPPRSEGVPPWVYHAILLGGGILSVLVSVLLPVYGRGIRGWYRLHVGTAVAGSLLVVPAVVLVFQSVYLSVPASIFFAHVLLGLLLLLFLAGVILLALLRGPWRSRRVFIRSAHIRAGRAFVLLMVANVLAGLAAVGIL